MTSEVIYLICAAVLIVLSFIIWICSRYRKCPSDKIMVVYGSIGKNKDGTNRSAKCIHGGAEFVIPVFQSYAYLDLTPISIQVDLKNALSKQNIRIARVEISRRRTSSAFTNQDAITSGKKKSTEVETNPITAVPINPQRTIFLTLS